MSWEKIFNENYFSSLSAVDVFFYDIFLLESQNPQAFSILKYFGRLHPKDICRTDSFTWKFKITITSVQTENLCAGKMGKITFPPIYFKQENFTVLNFEAGKMIRIKRNLPYTILYMIKFSWSQISKSRNWKVFFFYTLQFYTKFSGLKIILSATLYMNFFKNLKFRDKHYSW